jgi:omega-6 fatty acid desaturase (delta-12 desaturase)
MPPEAALLNTPATTRPGAAPLIEESMGTENRAALRAAVAPFEMPSVSRAVFQLFTSLGLYLMVVGLMYWALSYSYWMTLALAPIAGGLLIRTFIVQHDCGHGSFFRSPRANDVTGAILGLFTLAPYQSWRRQHALHHSNWNNLDRRESGTDIYSACLTVEEYLALSRRQRFFYRLVRHPLVAHVAIPPLVFLVLFVAMGLICGFGAVLEVQLPIIVVTTVVGVWLFSVQHRFDHARWFRQAEWSFQRAAMTGTSYLELPRLLQWFTGNIGFHHIHHLSPRVPNYRLEACHRASSVLREENPLTLGRAFAAGNLTLWDESEAKLVRFRDAKSGRLSSVQS